VAVAAAVVVFWLRTASAPIVFPAPGEVRLFDTDPYYHLRHARYAAAHFPHLQRWDPGLYPNGQPGAYVGLFDLTIAASALVAGGGHASPELVERVAAWVPPVIGSLAFLALFWLGRLAAGPIAGALATLFLLLDPGLFGNRALLGYPDHHVAEVLLGLLVAGGLCRCLQRARAERTTLRPAVLEALPLVLFFLTWLGAPIYLVLIGVTLFLVATVDIARGAGAGSVANAAFRYALGMAAVLVPVWLLVPWLILEQHFFRESLFALFLLGAGIPAYAWLAALVQRRGLPPLAIAALGFALVAAMAILGVLYAPGGRPLANQLLEVKTALVREQRDIGIETYFYLGSTPAALAFLAVPLIFFDAARGRDRRAAIAPILFGALLVALWVRTHDYGYAAPAYLAFLAAYVVVRLAAWLPRLWLRVVYALVIVVAVVLPTLLSKVVPPQRQADKLTGIMILDEGWVHALRWLRDHTPKPIVPIDATVPVRGFEHPPGDYGILAFWDFGHFIAAIGERLPLASGGISGPLARWFLIEDEEEAVKPEPAGLKEGQKVGYVMVDARTAGDFFLAGLEMAGRVRDDYRVRTQNIMHNGHELDLWVFGGRFPKTMISRLYLGNGNDLAHFRLVYESPERSASSFMASPDPAGNKTQVTRRSLVLADDTHVKSWRQLQRMGKPAAVGDSLIYDVAVEPTVKIFEEVKGAVLEGYADPGARVTAKIELRARTAKELVHYQRTGTADGDGHYLVVVPYPTDAGDDTDVIATGPYRVEATGKPAVQVPVTTAEVRAGTRVAIP